MKPVYFNDASANLWQGFSDGTTWNGWDNVWVTPTTWEEMLAKWAVNGDDAESIQEMREQYTVGEDGLVCLGYGLCNELGLSDEQLQVFAPEWRAYDEEREHCPASRDAFIWEAAHRNQSEKSLYEEVQAQITELYRNHGEAV